ncbi:thyrotroph embryonic factor-like [Asterias amurensis]|uniref:thyrotroph embryonic factor-like n=1 Tax=Asterias amurensis TaxID=7602 RepID=UPI003AB28F26
MDNLLKNLSGVTLKSLLENPSLLQPSQLAPLHLDDGLPAAAMAAAATLESVAADNATKEKERITSSMTAKELLEKKVKEVEGDFFVPTDFGAAFLGPNLWDKTYGDDDFNFKLEYMELDEFLSENGLPMSSVDNVLTNEQQKEEDISKKDCEEVDSNVSDVNYQSDSEIPESLEPSNSHHAAGTPSPINVDVNFDMDATDAALATVPGQDVYDPRTRTFSEEELKPQPMIKKSRKVYVLPDQKDDKYWDRRRKNNIAAKRSRDARRIKENQISMRAAFLEKENNVLRKELLAVKKDNVNLKGIVKSYERKLGIQ